MVGDVCTAWARIIYGPKSILTTDTLYYNLETQWCSLPVLPNILLRVFYSETVWDVVLYILINNANNQYNSGNQYLSRFGLVIRLSYNKTTSSLLWNISCDFSFIKNIYKKCKCITWSTL